MATILALGMLMMAPSYAHAVDPEWDYRETLSAARAFDFVNSSDGWMAAGTTLRRTSDGGITWETIPDAPILGGIRAKSDTELFGWGLTDANETFYRSFDGGFTWTRATFSYVVFGDVARIHGVRMFNDREGIASGEMITQGSYSTPRQFVTDDGGASWRSPLGDTIAFAATPASTPCTYPEPKTSLISYARRDTMGLARVGDEVWTWGSGMGTLWHSCDRGATWKDQWVTTDGEWMIYEADAVDENHLMALAYSGFDSANTRLYSTENGGYDVHDAHVFGPDRYATNARAVQRAFPGTAQTLIVASGVSWPDALGASALAQALDAPLMLSAPDRLPSVIRDEIVRLGAKSAIIIGSKGAISDEVKRQIEAVVGTGAVTRIGGADRYETSALVAVRTVDELSAAGGAYTGKVFVATGATFADALAASPIAAKRGIPVVLVERDRIPGAVRDALIDIGAREGLVLGGPGAISDPVRTALDQWLVSGTSRIAGTDRFATACAVARYGVDAEGLEWDHVAIANGRNFPDALSAGFMQARAGSVLLLSDPASLPSSTASQLTTEADQVRHIAFLGGTAVLNDHVRDSVVALLR